jgi:rubrerythrin
MNQQLNELLLQSLETELGGVQIYQTALDCVVNKDLQEEWEKYLDQTTRHVEVMRELLRNSASIRNRKHPVEKSSATSASPW